MAKKQEQVGASVANLFAKTARAKVDESAIPAEGYTRSVSCGLRESEVELLNGIAQELGVARNAVMRHILRWGAAEYLAGRLTIPIDEKTTRRVVLP